MNTVGAIASRDIALLPMIACLSLVAAGCATGPPKSGFLDDYSEFERVREDAPVWQAEEAVGFDPDELHLSLWRYLEESHRLADYDRIIIDPVVVRLGEGAAGANVDPQRVEEFTHYLHDTLVDALADRYPLADAPAERVLRFRTALTGVWPMHVPMRNRSMTSHSMTARASNSFPGGASFEGEAIDAVSAERIIGIIAVARGTQWGAAYKGEGSDVYGQAKIAVAGLARVVRETMDEAHDGG